MEGLKLTLKECCAALGGDHGDVLGRLRRGYTPEAGAFMEELRGGRERAVPAIEACGRSSGGEAL